MAFNELIRLGASAAGDYEIEKSLRFNPEDDSYLHRPPSGAGNRKTWTWSGWVKRGSTFTRGVMFGCGTGLGSNEDGIEFDGVVIRCYSYTGSFGYQFTTSAYHRDPAAWLHIVFSLDTTQSSSGERGRLYVNGERVTALATETQPSLNADGAHINTTSEHKIGNQQGSHEFDGYLADVNFIDGTRLDASSFGKTNIETGQWIPKKYGGSYGTNGFHLDFSDNSGTTATTLGKDSSGNGNNWTPSGFSVAAGDGNDSKTDTPTNNKVTLNPHWHFSKTLTQGNLGMGGSAGSNEIATIGVPGTSSFYYEVVWSTIPGWCTAGVVEGLYSTNGDISSFTNILYDTKITAWHSTGASVQQGSYNGSDGTSWSTTDVIGIKYVNGTLTLYKDGTANGTTKSVSSNTSTIYPHIQADGSTVAAYVRFSSNEWTETPTGVDADWEVDIARLTEPPIVKPTDHVKTILYTGNATSRNIVSDFSTDFVWIKRRSGGDSHVLANRVLGADKFLSSDLTDDENTASNCVTAFNSDGVTVGTQGIVNDNTEPFESTHWDESATAGFDIVSYIGDGSAGNTFSHSLGVVPDLIIIKNRSTDGPHWFVYMRTMGNTTWIPLDTNSTANTSVTDTLNSTSPTSSVVTLGDNNKVNASGSNYIAYLWSSVSGFSKFGFYTGNGDGNGPFVYTGFKPAFIVAKNTATTNYWRMTNNKNNPYNEVANGVYPNVVSAADSPVNWTCEWHSNGFKVRNSNGEMNGSGQDIIYWAWAETPFKYSNAR